LRPFSPTGDCKPLGLLDKLHSKKSGENPLISRTCKVRQLPPEKGGSQGRNWCAVLPFGGLLHFGYAAMTRNTGMGGTVSPSWVSRGRTPFVGRRATPYKRWTHKARLALRPFSPTGDFKPLGFSGRNPLISHDFAGRARAPRGSRGRCLCVVVPFGGLPHLFSRGSQ
jgi:hypothetical protein